jgi:hypothetical protein
VSVCASTPLHISHPKLMCIFGENLVLGFALRLNDRRDPRYLISTLHETQIKISPFSKNGDIGYMADHFKTSTISKMCFRNIRYRKSIPPLQ